MREIVHIQAGQCGNQIGAKVRTDAALLFHGASGQCHLWGGARSNRVSRGKVLSGGFCIPAVDLLFGGGWWGDGGAFRGVHGVGQPCVLSGDPELAGKAGTDPVPHPSGRCLGPWGVAGANPREPRGGDLAAGCGRAWRK